MDLSIPNSEVAPLRIATAPPAAADFLLLQVVVIATAPASLKQRRVCNGDGGGKDSQGAGRRRLVEGCINSENAQFYGGWPSVRGRWLPATVTQGLYILSDCLTQLEGKNWLGGRVRDSKPRSGERLSFKPLSRYTGSFMHYCACACQYTAVMSRYPNHSGIVVHVSRGGSLRGACRVSGGVDEGYIRTG
jgi:hypothetical protein